jgi:hypothetical protein
MWKILNNNNNISYQGTIVIFGWFGAKQSHLQHYVTLAQCILPEFALFHHTVPIQYAAQLPLINYHKHIELLAQQLYKHAKPPYILHALSNNGAIAAAYLAQHIPPQDIAAMSFDSSPAYLNNHLIQRGIIGFCQTVTQNQFLLNKIIPNALHLYLNMPHLKKTIAEINEILAALPVTNTLVIYSSNDKVILQEEVEAFLQDHVQIPNKGRLMTRTILLDILLED